jgi:hypothetical protein
MRGVQPHWFQFRPLLTLLLCLLLLLQATIAGGGVIPHIHKSLINKGPKKE